MTNGAGTTTTTSSSTISSQPRPNGVYAYRGTSLVQLRRVRDDASRRFPSSSSSSSSTLNHVTALLDSPMPPHPTAFTVVAARPLNPPAVHLQSPKHSAAEPKKRRCRQTTVEPVVIPSKPPTPLPSSCSPNDAFGADRLGLIPASASRGVARAGDGGGGDGGGNAESVGPPVGLFRRHSMISCNMFQSANQAHW